MQNLEVLFLQRRHERGCSYLKEDEIEVRVGPLPAGKEFRDGGDAAEDVPAAVERLRDVPDGPAVQREGAQHAAGRRPATGFTKSVLMLDGVARREELLLLHDRHNEKEMN